MKTESFNGCTELKLEFIETFDKMQPGKKSKNIGISF